MNKCVISGRLVADPDIKWVQNSKGEDMCIARFRLAVDRRAKRGEKQEADFINCVAFGKTGEFYNQYVRKGIKIMVSGRIQTGSYEKDGRKVYTTDIVVEETEFCESKKTNEETRNASPVEREQAKAAEDFMSVPDDIESELPFS